VRLRANDACEYCLHPTVGQFHIDHIISLVAREGTPILRFEEILQAATPVRIEDVVFHAP
jgi:hypothetical protein